MATKVNYTLIQTNDGKIFKVAEDIIVQMRSFYEMFVKLGQQVDESQVTAVPALDSAIFAKVIEWCEVHKGEPVPEHDGDKRCSTECKEWEAKFLEENEKILVELMKTANFLELDTLVNATCEEVASMLKGKSAAEMRRLFNVQCDYTDEDLAQVKEENDWRRLSFYTE